MKNTNYIFIFIFCLFLISCKQNSGKKTDTTNEFAKEMVEFIPSSHNPLFSGTNTDTWDKHIRERGYIMFENGLYKMWYTGYTDGDKSLKSLGYATSKDGINWDRYSKNPIFSQKWTEDVFVMKQDGIYYMFAEGETDINHMLTSDDGINWQEQGDLVILSVSGDTIPGPYGTTSVIIENDKWYMFYERFDKGIWVATSEDKKIWTNIQDDPVLKNGPEIYDESAVATNQVIKYKGKFYMYYHGSTYADWASLGATSSWTSNVAMSTDLINWVKYPDNPIVGGGESSPILVYDGSNYQLYTMHNEVRLHNAK
jgi:beta-1,2-mannobiose phosphorylase / 1,2-beta-oligomannan phosphorylase